MKKIEHFLLGLILGFIGGYAIYVLFSAMLETRILSTKQSGYWLLIAVIGGAIIGAFQARRLDRLRYKFKTWHKVLIWSVFIFLVLYIYWFSTLIQRSVRNIQAL